MVIKEMVHITPYHLDRMLHIYLPDDYEESEARYPVMYMYDGHNLFYNEDATYGKSWMPPAAPPPAAAHRAWSAASAAYRHQ